MTLIFFVPVRTTLFAFPTEDDSVPVPVPELAFENLDSTYDLVTVTGVSSCYGTPGKHDDRRGPYWARPAIPNPYASTATELGVPCGLDSIPVSPDFACKIENTPSEHDGQSQSHQSTIFCAYASGESGPGDPHGFNSNPVFPSDYLDLATMRERKYACEDPGCGNRFYNASSLNAHKTV